MTNFAKGMNSSKGTPLNIASDIVWEKLYQDLLRQFLKTHDEFDGSAVAAWMRRHGLHDPSHHNKWGTQINYYANLGWYTKIGSAVPTGAAHISQVGYWKSDFFPRRKRKSLIGGT